MVKETKELTVGQMLGNKVWPLVIGYNDGKNKYVEQSDGFWVKKTFDSNGKLIRLEKSNGSWYKYEYDNNGNVIRCEYSNGGWSEYEYDSKGNQNYF